MAAISAVLTRYARYIGAHDVSDVDVQEANRALHRGVVALGVASVWLVQLVTGQAIHASPWFVFVVAVAVPALAFGYRRYVLRRKVANLAAFYLFLVLDPLLCVGALLEDPQTFAFFNPFLIVVVVRSGLRYGVRTLYLTWAATLLLSTSLLLSPFWRDESELTAAYLLLLLLVPVFFASLIRRIHNVRAIEGERARLAAMHDVTVARSAFLAKVSHELRSPLQGIVSALDVLAIRQGPSRDVDAELIGRIRRSSLLLNTHLRDLLTLARGESGGLEMRPEPFDACSLVESVATSASDLASAKGLELKVDLPTSAVFVVADSARIDQVLTNLVINSVRYTETGQVRVTLRNYDPDERLLLFIVADTGPGIPQAMLPMLLAPDKVVTGSERRGEGSGLGLAIVRTLMAHLGGRIKVTSSVGLGTTFTLAIPAEPVDADDEEETVQSPTGRMLIVDDREDILDALASVVDELGFECDRATSTAVGANLLASRVYDVALVDIEMPVKNGAELLAETRRGGGPNCATRFIGMSAGEVHQDIKSQFDACLAKPINHEALRRALLGPGHGARPSQPGLWAEVEVPPARRRMP